MADQSEGEHVSNTKQEAQTSRDTFELSCDSLSDDTTKTKGAYGISTKSDWKTSLLSGLSQLNPFRKGNGKHMEPGKPFIKDVSSDSVVIQWDAVNSLSTGDFYQVLIENIKEGSIVYQGFKTNFGKIVDLQPSTPYTFKVMLVKGNREQGSFGETSEVVKTKEEPIPGKPSIQHVFADRVDMIWKRVDTFRKGDVYEVHVENIDTKENICHTFHINCATIEDLQPDSTYVFKVRLVEQKGKLSKYSENSDRVKTCSTFASKLIRTQSPVKTSCKGLYELPLDEVRHATNADARSIKYDIGPTGRDQIVEKTIMLVGASGTGKSTFVDSLANYVLGVRLEDPYRFTVTREEDREKQTNKAISQTDWITFYTFNPQEGTRLTYRLNVIDTPGVGDTRGKTRDKEIISQIHKLFKAPGEEGVKTLDAVCFFVKASDCRLTKGQLYIFNAIQSLFGKDIKGNICLLLTFADGSDPAAMDAVRESGLPYGEHFSFNNLSFSADPTQGTTSMFWNMSSKSFRALFSHLETLETQSLQITKDVLKERQRLEITYQNLQRHINDRISVMNGMKQEMKILQEHVNEINKNKNFTYTVKELKVITVDLPRDERATNCLICKTTCHNNCSAYFESYTRLCWAFSWLSGDCLQCPKHCSYRSHETTGHRFITYEEDVEKKYGEMQERFQDATKKSLDVKEVIDKMKGEQEANVSEIKAILMDMLKCKNRLSEIALLPDQCSIHGLFEQLIKAERTEGKPGFEDRIEQLRQLSEETSLEGSQNIEIRSDN